ncbi:uncharacterized protein LOC119095575 [Pollicipes pollicipes]|uniref:uncharacterized protein LOC119095575 n=1 Tax=Pollicipes pollicipes TaxID=41117 RepID=UPI0018855180|nr:uncharacterized protein LOC119095575 [Pollicipes pollicipes]
MRTAILILCAVAAETAPLAAKSVAFAVPDLPALTTAPSVTSATTADVKITKLKKFQPTERGLFTGKKPLAPTAKLGGADATLTPEPSVGGTGTSTAATPAAEIPTTEESQTDAPLAAVESSSPVPEADVELLKSHIAAPLVAGSFFEDAKARRFDHSALFGYSSFF